jgi:hypothetical protein
MSRTKQALSEYIDVTDGHQDEDWSYNLDD